MLRTRIKNCISMTSLYCSAQSLDMQGASLNFMHAALSVRVVFLKYLVSSDRFIPKGTL